MTISYPPPLQASPRREIQANRVWRDFGPTSLAGLKEPEISRFKKPCISITQDTLLAAAPHRTQVRFDIDREWSKWKATDAPAIRSKPVKPQPSFSLLMCPRRDPDPRHPGVTHDRLALSEMPASRERFLDILTRMHVPHEFLDTLIRPKTIFRKLKSSVEGQDCEVYILCVDSVLNNYAAMCVTYFPHSQQVFGLYLGYDDSTDDVADMTSHLVKNKDFSSNPFVLISTFLEIEKKHRLKQVDSTVDALHIKIESSRQALRDLGPSQIEDTGEGPDFSTLSRRAGVLKIQLANWKPQLNKLLAICPDLPAFLPKQSGGFVLSPKEYVEDLRDSFEESILRCENILQATSLAFQQQQADRARKDTYVAINDAKQMKAIALLTMFFLPATAVAGFMDAPVYDWEGRGYFFWVITAPITITVISFYFLWTFLAHRSKL